MSKPAFVLCPMALALLAACAAPERVVPAPRPTVVTPPPVVSAPPPGAPGGAVGVVIEPPTVVVQTPALRPGLATIEAVRALPRSAAGGASAATAATAASQRLTLRMQDGSVQQVDAPLDHFSTGERVEIGADGTLRRRAPEGS